ncbi:MAG: 16S rRNA (guanine(527)-N(7))-methyltransferase RsmG, partial [Bacteroidia bacterium]|nr:16S rRNA (guanine(527)-N(7))-methyltransferase RsmG [Bacteroidia bacterium]
MIFEDFKNIVKAEFPDVTETAMSQFEAMDALYRDWNSKINVISRKDMDGFYEHHVLHSLGIAAWWRRQGIVSDGAGLTVLDLGTGGGFPGIPLAVLFPKMQFTLCDSIGKKVKVATEVAAALGLQNVQTVNARAESLPGTFDFVVSRAVTSLDNFYPWVKGKF